MIISKKVKGEIDFMKLNSSPVDRLFEVYDSAEEAVKSYLPHPEAAASWHFISRLHSKRRFEGSMSVTAIYRQLALLAPTARACRAAKPVRGWVENLL